jgi:hypothetical protein
MKRCLGGESRPELLLWLTHTNSVKLKIVEIT